MWLKKLKTVSAELMTSALSGERGKSGKVFAGFPGAFGAPPPACPRRSLPPFPGVAIRFPRLSRLALPRFQLIRPI
jgi:hypothetical protein